AAAQFGFVAGVDAGEHGLVVARGVVGAAEAAEERIAGFAGAAAELEFGFAEGETEEADELELRVVEEGAIEELEFPIRAAADVENAIGGAAAIEEHDAAIVVQRGFVGDRRRG